nr:hypothetical protein [Phenylobacterium sp.]
MAAAGRQRMKQSFLGLAAFAATLAVGLSAEAPARAAPIDSQGAVFTDAAFDTATAVLRVKAKSCIRRPTTPPMNIGGVKTAIGVHRSFT